MVDDSLRFLGGVPEPPPPPPVVGVAAAVAATGEVLDEDISSTWRSYGNNNLHA